MAAHCCFEAAKQFDLAKVPVYLAEGLTPAQVRAYRLMNNRSVQDAEWDDELLAFELKDLQLGDFDLGLTGFDGDEIDGLLAGAVDGMDGLGDADSNPEPPTEPVSRPGDLWVLGNHRLLCGEATVLTDIEHLMDGHFADMCFTDSPYSVDYANAEKDKIGGKRRPILNDNLGERFEAFLYDACVNVVADVKGTGHVAKEDAIYKIFKRIMNTGVATTGALIALPLSIVGYLLVNPIDLH